MNYVGAYFIYETLRSLMRTKQIKKELDENNRDNRSEVKKK